MEGDTKITVLAVCAAASLAAVGSAEAEFFGAFSGDPQGAFRDVPPRPMFELNADFSFTDPNGLVWTTPKGEDVDGASIPQVFWSMIGGPFEGPYFYASIIHDHYCRTKERTAHDTHRDFYYGMLARGVPIWKAEAMYWAVATFGPQWQLEDRIVEEKSCATVGGVAKCTITPMIKTVVTAEPEVDLSDPTIRAVSLAKFNAIARTLKTSDGQILDVGANGSIKGSIDSIEQNAASVRQSIKTEVFLTNPNVLGLMSQPDAANLDAVPVWTGGILPTFADTPTLLEKGVGDGSQVNGFRLNPSEVTNLRDQLQLKSQTYSLPSALSP